MNDRFRVLVLLTVVFGLYGFGVAQSFDERVLGERSRQAYRDLRTVEIFAIGGVGYSGEISSGEAALDILVDDKESVAGFKDLVVTGTIEAGLYGLFGLKILGCDCFEAEFDKFSNRHLKSESADVLKFQSGCELFPAEVLTDKKLVIGEMMKNWFSSMARAKEGRRQTKKIRGNQS